MSQPCSITPSKSDWTIHVTPSVGLPFLRLPEPQQAFANCEGHGRPAEHGEFDPLPPKPTTSDSEAAIYRWFVGHRASILAWRILSDALHAISSHSDSIDQEIELAELCYSAYSIILLYTSRLSAEAYNDVIRPRMFEFDPAFSGRWAADYAHIPELLRHTRSSASNEKIDRLISASKLNLIAHTAVARKLVPNGVSLLRESGRSHQKVTRREQGLFDQFFGIERTTVCRDAVHEQMRQTFMAVVSDIQNSPLVLTSADCEGLSRHQVDNLASLCVSATDTLNSLTQAVLYQSMKR